MDWMELGRTRARERRGKGMRKGNGKGGTRGKLGGIAPWLLVGIDAPGRHHYALSLLTVTTLTFKQR